MRLDLLRNIKNGDTGSFNELYDLYSIRLLNFALMYLDSKVEAEEVVQDVFCKIWQNRHKLDEKFSLNGYIFRVTKNLVLNKLRKRINEPSGYVPIGSCSIHHNKTENDILFYEMERLLEDAIEALPPRRQLIFKLSREKGLSNQEIADHLDISVNTVEGQIRKAIKYLRSYIKIVSLTVIFIFL
ncbi:MAG: RNA polymerase sigma-70 factor [Cytophagales bacterium]|nr:RNA polymerase sigma-70 factor [Cytophagales bacterium]